MFLIYLLKRLSMSQKKFFILVILVMEKYLFMMLKMLLGFPQVLKVKKP